MRKHECGGSNSKAEAGATSGGFWRSWERWRSRNFRILEAIARLTGGGERMVSQEPPRPFLTLNCSRAARQTSYLFHVYFTVLTPHFFSMFHLFTSVNSQYLNCAELLAYIIICKNKVRGNIYKSSLLGKARWSQPT